MPFLRWYGEWGTHIPSSSLPYHSKPAVATCCLDMMFSFHSRELFWLMHHHISAISRMPYVHRTDTQRTHNFMCHTLFPFGYSGETADKWSKKSENSLLIMLSHDFPHTPRSSSFTLTYIIYSFVVIEVPKFFIFWTQVVINSLRQNILLYFRGGFNHPLSGTSACQARAGDPSQLRWIKMDWKTLSDSVFSWSVVLI